MFPSKALLSLILLCTLTAVDAVSVNRRTGKATLGFFTKFNARGGLNIAEIDRARVRGMKQASQLGKRGVSSIDVTTSGVNYHAEVGFGSPPTNYTMLVDTGSANTWVGAGRAYKRTKTSKNTGDYVSANYGSGSFQGEEWTDTVTLNPSLVIDKQSIGVANSSSGIPSGIDGILGVGPVNLTQGTVNGMDTVPTVMDNLRSQRTIPEEVLGVYFIPYPDSTNGELTFGGYNPSATVGPVVYAPLTTTQPASAFWGIELSIGYGADTILNSTAGIIDTGTTLTLIATDAFNKYKSMTGGVPDNSTGLLRITSDQYSKLKPLKFDIRGVSFELTPNAQIWPRSLNTAIGGAADAIYLIVSDIGYESGSGLDFTNGYTFLERYYSVYDTTNKRVGFASTKYTYSKKN